MVSVQASSVRIVRVAIEDVCHALGPESVASLIRQGNDKLDAALESSLSFDPTAGEYAEHSVL